MDPTSHSLNEKSLITPRWSEGEEPAETRVHLGEQSFPNVYEETSDVVSRQGESRTREKLRTIEAQDTFPREAREKMSRGMQKYHRSMLNHPSVSIILLIQCLAHSTALGVQLFSTIHLWQREKIEEPSHMWFIIEYLVLASHFVFFLETFARNHILSYWFLTYGRTACFNTIEVICLPISLVLELIHAGLSFTLGNTTALLVCRLIVIFFFVPCVLRRRLSLLKSNIRSLVSADRRRYLDMGYDLDITYIARNIIAMSWPSSSIEAFFRNNIKSVAEFMNTHHADCYVIFNLCGERSYDPAHFNGRVQRYFMEDHCPVELETVLAFCTKAHSYLSQDTRHTIVVHCKGGKGRTGMMISCYLLYSGAVHDSKSALEHFGMSRTADGARSFQGVESPSQARFVQYFEKFIREPHTTAPRRRRTRIRKIIVGPLPLEASFPSLMWFAILENQTEQFLLKNPAAHQALPSDAKSHARQVQVQKSPGLRMTSRAHNPSVFTRDPFNYCKREKKHSEKETNCTRQQLLQCIEHDAMCYKVRYADSGKTVCGFDFYKTEEAIFLTSKSEMKSEVDRQPALPSLNSIQEVPNVEIVREGPSNDTKVLRRPPEVYIEYDLDEIVSSMRALQHTQEPTGASSDPFDNQVHASSRIAFFYDSCIPLTSESIFQMWFHPAYEDFDVKPSQSDSTSHIVAPKNEKFRTFRLSRKDIDGPHKQTSGKGGVKGAIASAASGMSTTLVFREDFEICMELEVME